MSYKLRYKESKKICESIMITLSCLCMSLFLFASPGYAESKQNAEPNLEQLEEKINRQQLQINDLLLKVGDVNQLENMSEEESESGTLDISGFFDVTAHTTDKTEHPFDLGSLELDMQYDQGENFAVSTALVWDGDVSEVAVAVLDYHVNSHNVPTRGHLFGEPGYHIQFGRFDIPFGIDYEYFASVDRPNITAPLTTQRIQNGGFNGDGVRAYGTWSQFDYAFYWTNSLTEDNGNSVGTRIGFFPGRDPFSAHKRDAQNDFTAGLSWLHDMDSEEERRSTLYAVDVSWRYHIVELIIEYISRNNIDTITLPGGGSAGPADEQGYNTRLLFDFDPLSVFVSYGEWNPDYSAVIDPDDATVSYSVEKLNRVTLGGRYVVDDYLQMKLEYLNHVGTSTSEPDFEKSRLTFQMVASF